MATWQFYGRSQELDRLREMLARRRWFFCKLSGRRRIGKTALVQQALPLDARNVLYLQLWTEVAESLPSYRLSKFQPLMPPWVEREVVAGYLLDVDGAKRWLAGSEPHDRRRA
jgi:AAA+ ATPase superfamily predicted ATPase